MGVISTGRALGTFRNPVWGSPLMGLQLQGSPTALQDGFVDGSGGYSVASLGVELAGVEEGIGEAMATGNEGFAGNGGLNAAETVLQEHFGGRNVTDEGSFDESHAASMQTGLRRGQIAGEGQFLSDQQIGGDEGDLVVVSSASSSPANLSICGFTSPAKTGGE